MPLLIVLSAVSPTSGKDAASLINEELGLRGRSAEVVREAVAQPATVQDGINLLGFLILVLSALAFTRALQRLYVRAWGLEKLGMRGNAWGLIWLLAFSIYISSQPLIVGVFDGITASIVSLALSAGLWLFTPWILLGRELPWQRLLPQALLTDLGVTSFGIASVIYMPGAVSTAATRFGFIGLAFALLSWLFVVSFLLVVTAAVGATLARDGGLPQASPAFGRPADDDHAAPA